MADLASATKNVGGIVDTVTKAALRSAEELRKALNALDEANKQEGESAQKAQDAHDAIWGPLVTQTTGIIDMAGQQAHLGMSVMGQSDMTSDGMHLGGGTVGGGTTGTPPAPPSEPYQAPITNPTTYFDPGSSG